MKRWLGKLVIGLIAALSVVYVGDWGVWRARVAMGGGMGKVTVADMTAVTLKDNKEEYFYNGSTVEDCSQSIFPQAGGGACWWLNRHKIVFEK
jgi:hypothetical protein